MVSGRGSRTSPLVDLPRPQGFFAFLVHEGSRMARTSWPADPPGPEQTWRTARLEAKSTDGDREAWSEVRMALEELSLFKLDENKASTMALLSASNLLVHLLDKIGPTMLVLRQDIQTNIERVEEVLMLDPDLNSSLVEIVKKEVEEGTSRKAGSCSRATLWLTRSIVFSLTLFQKLDKNPELKLEQAVEETYNEVLKPWHGWISSAAYKIALKLVPERETLIRLLMGQEEDYEALRQDAKNYVSVIQPLLDETCAVLSNHHLDKFKST